MNGAAQRFSELVGLPDADVPLDEAALLVAAHAYPDLDVPAELARLDLLASTCAVPTLDGLCRHLFDELGFSGNTRRYGDPRNSFLNEVVSRRVGIPISLSVLTIEVGRRVGVPLVGVGLPGHFLVRSADDPSVLLDPFNAGRRLGLEDCTELFRAVHGAGAPFDPDLLAPVGPRAILVRMLANLRQVYGATGDARGLGEVLRLRVAIPASSVPDWADLARALASLGRYPEAATILDELSEALPAPASGRARNEALALRARLN